MPQKVKPEDFIAYGIQTSGVKMDNGETRFRLTSAQSSYIRTETKDQTGWQNSHYHSEQTEVFLVEKGEVLCAAIVDEKIVLKMYYSGECFSVGPMIPHNLRLSKNSLMHTVKYGGKPDWIAYPQLDQYLRMKLQ